MLALTLALMLALVACARADCDACVDSVCHSRQTFLKGFLVTDQLAIDRTHNVLYTQLHHDQNIALFLDRPEIRLLHTMRTSGMAIDQRTQTLYLSTKEIANTFYKYSLESNKTETFLIDADNRRPKVMFYSDYTVPGELYFTDNNKDGLWFVNKTYAKYKYWYVTQLTNYTISDFVLDKDGKIFFLSNDKLYLYEYKNGHWQTPPRLIAQKNHVLSADGYGAVYFGDVSQKVIHTRDNTTGRLELYASYKSGAVEDFVFDRDNNIVFRDADGGVARWVPAPARARCRVEPPHEDYLIRELPDNETCIQ